MPPALEIRGWEIGNLEGAWSPNTATIDWCESNYVITAWVAEWYNSVSNLVAIGLAVFGVACCRDAGLSPEFAAAHAGLGIIGVGSALFHGTLLWSAQLLDELPMIWASCIFIYAVATRKIHSTLGRLLPAVLAVFAVAITAIYVHSQRFDFFEAMYAVQVVIIVSTSIHHLHCFNPDDDKDTVDATATESRRHELKRLLVLALSYYFGGYALWNIDNYWCTEIKNLRSRLPGVLAPATQLHALWHVGTQYGTFVSITFTTLARCHEDGLAPKLCWTLHCVPSVRLGAGTTHRKKAA